MSRYPTEKLHLEPSYQKIKATLENNGCNIKLLPESNEFWRAQLEDDIAEKWTGINIENSSEEDSNDDADADSDSFLDQRLTSEIQAEEPEEDSPEEELVVADGDDKEDLSEEADQEGLASDDSYEPAQQHTQGCLLGSAQRQSTRKRDRQDEQEAIEKLPASRQRRLPARAPAAPPISTPAPTQGSLPGYALATLAVFRWRFVLSIVPK